MPSTSNQSLRDLFIVPHPIEGPLSRFRIYQFIPYLEAHGIDCTVRPFLNSDQIFALYRPGGTLKKIWLTLRGLGGRILDGIGVWHQRILPSTYVPSDHEWEGYNAQFEDEKDNGE